MRNRHLARVCGTCVAPMAAQEDKCWRCGVEWAPEEGPRTTLHLISGDAHEQTAEAERPTLEDGGFASEVTAPLPAAAARR
jgi:hypothetical protein